MLEKAFAGIPAGARMLVVTPSVVDAAVVSSDIRFWRWSSFRCRLTEGPERSEPLQNEAEELAGTERVAVYGRPDRLLWDDWGR